MKTHIRSIKPIHIIGNCKIPGIVSCINPYVGCEYGCPYCYARCVRRFTDHEWDAEWGSYVDIKVNAAELLPADLRSKVKAGSTVLVGSVTDPYQPLEEKHKITRSILQRLAAAAPSLERPFRLSILTKSDLVLRDLDLLKKLPDVTVGFSIAWTDEEALKVFEPNCPSIPRRLAALEKLKKAGIPTYAFIAPILPGVTELSTVFAALTGKVDSVFGETFNTRCGTLKDTCELAVQYDWYRGRTFADDLRDPSYWNMIRREFQRTAVKCGIEVEGFFCHHRAAGTKERGEL
ncbi:MAG: radical SAM protein [Planctomycetaceae bacterium]|jgi:DNA repair photolyase|nr:radical SAM protein [Planctomycetaceae bacterium]